MLIRVARGLALAALPLMIAGCQSQTPPAQSTSTPSVAPAPNTAKPHRVFFVSPKNGETIKTMAKLEFGNDGHTIGAVPKEAPTEAQVRPGVGHYHVAVDADCLPPGTVIPKADPWIHFGDGKNVIEMQLKPGPHRLTLQMGDDLHRTVAGMCETINVTVVE